MAIGLIGKKLGMTQVFTPEGTLVPVTVLQAGPCTVVQRRTPERDGYAGVQLGFGEQKAQRLTRAERGHRKASGTMARVLSEFRDGADYDVGQQIRVGDVFAAGDRVDVTGTSKGRGFAGVMKRHRFGGFPRSHGTHEYFRHGGAIGNRSYPGRVFKGKGMAGHYGADRVTTQSLEVVEVRPEDDLLLIRGSVPGARNGVVMIRKAVRHAVREAAGGEA